MNSAKKISKFIAFSFILVLGFYPMAGGASDITQQEVFSDTISFYTKTEKGTLAIISELEETKYKKYAPNQKHPLDRRPEYEFIVNHMGETTSNYTYLAVEVIRVFPGKDKEDVKQGFLMKRNDGWVRTSRGPLPEQTEHWNKGLLEDFRSIHEDDNLRRADMQLGFKWHAQPHKDSQSSWAQHKWWAEPTSGDEANRIKSALIEKINNSPAHGSFRLYRFREMDKDDTKNQLKFTVRSHSCSHMFIRTYSPISKKYNGYYHFELN